MVGFGGEPEGQAEQEGARQEQGEVQQEEQEAGAGGGVRSGERHQGLFTGFGVLVGGLTVGNTGRVAH